MDDAERAWLREKLYEHAAELGAQKAEQRALSEGLGSIRAEMREGLGSISKEMRDGLARTRSDMEAQYAHVRGEIVSLRDEERRRADDLIERLEDSADRSRGLNRALLFGVGVLIVFGQQVVEHLPRILELIAP